MDSGRSIASSNIISFVERYKRLLSYFVVGGLSACVDFSLFFFSVYVLEIHYLLAGALGFIIATLVNYLLCNRYIFRNASRYGAKTKLFGVYLISGIGLLLHQILLFAMVEFVALHVVISKVLATAMIFFWNYFGRAYFVFR